MTTEREFRRRMLKAIEIDMRRDIDKLNQSRASVREYRDKYFFWSGVIAVQINHCQFTESDIKKLVELKRMMFFEKRRTFFIFGKEGYFLKGY